MRQLMWLRFMVLLLIMSGVAFAQNTAGYMAMPAGSGSYPPVPFDTSKSFLIYTTNNGDLVAAMNFYGLSYTARSVNNPVTALDLATHDILIVGWNTGTLATMNGLLPGVLEEGITGRVILTGHDADYHVPHEPAAGNVIFEQTIRYVLEGSGKGMVAFTDSMSNFAWLPESWGVTGNSSTGETIKSITPQGDASGIFADLTPALLSNWGVSYHNYFTAWGNGFEPLELGGGEGELVITLASPFNPRGFIFTKDDDLAEGETVCPQQELTYTICYDNTSGMTITNARIIDYLPVGVTYPEGEWAIDENMEPYQPDPAYDPDLHAYEWSVGQNELGTLYPDDFGCVTLRVVVNENAVPGMNLHNEAVLIGDYCYQDPNEPNNPSAIICSEVRYLAGKDTPVCCWEENGIIFVDQYAAGACTGLNWTDAYSGTDGLSKALYQAKNSTCVGPYTIYIASGNYFPGTQEEDSFVLPEGTQMYGGFPTGGCDFSLRNPKVYEALLTGQVDDDLFSEIDNVVTMGHNTLLDGVAIARGINSNIYGNTVDFTLKNCSIKESELYGIYALNGNVTIERCKIQENFSDGIYHSGIDFTLDVSNSWVMRNGRYGIYTYESNLLAKNSIISESDMNEQGSDGIFIVNPSNPPIIYNNTIANNKSAGIFFSDNGTVEDPNDYPDIQNCIIYYNNGGANQLNGLNPDAVASYSCIQNCNTVNNNINAAPMFAYPASVVGEPDPNDYHLAYNSPCFNAGSPNLDYSGQTDYDTEERVDGSRVEMGADELHSCSGDYLPTDFANQLDTNVDGIVNMNEFMGFAKAWLQQNSDDPTINKDPNFYDPNDYAGWNSLYNLDDTGTSQYFIDIADFQVFLEDHWLWQACRLEPSQSAVSGMDTMTENLSLSSDGVAKANTSEANVSTLARVSTKIILEEPMPVEEELNPYSEMSNSELALFVKDIQELKMIVAEQIKAECEDSEDLTDLIDFFDEILADVQETLQK
ncbi:MAG: right-handed parallel beta-helix repeat-containing protein [Sedimentisphaerales bacterium]|nr:right-handed parallel beta-helix repeat-containing protein [Sedimentisphaerales bacterium]MBN2842145.1 right-handed parallel beta-helix repeat-containing protein [Sedimentisphaerales bacterium]